MQADFVDKLKNSLSSERLTAYQKRMMQDDDLNLFSHYAWNMALSESLYPALQMLEIAFRNTLHQNAFTTFDQEDWFNNKQLIKPRDQATIAKAKNNLQRQKKPLDSGRVIAELNFGFWTTLLDSRYEQVLWPQLIKGCFPYMPRKIRTRKQLSQRFNKIRHLRNRIFHHEPIWHWHNLEQQHQDILEAITWIEPALRDLVMTVDRFPNIYQQGYQSIEKQLNKFCRHSEEHKTT